MRKIVIYCLLVSGVLLLMSCQRVSADDVASASGPTTFTATIAYSSSTKTTLSGSPGSSRKVYWSNGDKVMIGGEVYTLTDGEGTTSGTLEGSGAVLSEGVYKAYYPKGIWTDTGTPPALPAEPRHHAGGRIDNLPMYAQSSGTDLQFYNLCAVLNLRLRGTGTVAEVKVSSENWLSGPFEVKGSGTPSDGWYAQLTGGNESSKDVTLKCTPGVVLSETEDADLFIALPEGIYAKGTLTVAVWGTGSPSSPLKFYRNDRAPASGSELKRSYVYQVGGSSSSFDLGLEEVAWDGRLSATGKDPVQWEP